jgi:hypothetical protein
VEVVGGEKGVGDRGKGGAGVGEAEMRLKRLCR